MNSYLQVARTYWRPRFLVLAGFYAFVVLAWLRWSQWQDPTHIRGQVIVSALMASIVGCFLALHVRRQFGNPLAQLMPGFAAPHLAIGLLASLLLWLVVPLALVRLGHWPAGALAAHAVAGILFGAVAAWPKALMLLVALPVLLIWSGRWLPRQKPVLERLIEGHLPNSSAVLIALAVVAHLVAVIALVRIPRMAVSTSDELMLEPAIGAQAANPASAWLLNARDRAARRLGQSRLLRSVQRWRVPVAISWAQLAFPVLAVLIMCGIGWLTDSVADWASAATLIVSAVLIIVPYGPWHVRRTSLSLDFTRPVTRRDFFRQIALAVALDACVWLVVASLISACVLPLIPGLFRPEGGILWFLAGHLAILWGMAAFVYGLALATMRIRFWLPIVAVSAFAWLLGFWWSLAMLVEFGPWRGLDRVDPLYVVAGFALLSVCLGALLARLAHRRWLAADLA